MCHFAAGCQVRANDMLEVKACAWMRFTRLDHGCILFVCGIQIMSRHFLHALQVKAKPAEDTLCCFVILNHADSTGITACMHLCAAVAPDTHEITLHCSLTLGPSSPNQYIDTPICLTHPIMLLMW